MLFATIAWPEIDPVALQLGPLPIRWYALAYIAGLILGWAYARALVQRDAWWGGVARPSVASLDDLLVYAALGVVLGGLGSLFVPFFLVSMWNYSLMGPGPVLFYLAFLGLWSWHRMAIIWRW